MNKARRKEITALLADLAAIKDRVEALASEERDSFNNLSQGLQQSAAGQASEHAADALDDAAAAIDTTETELDNAQRGYT